LTKTETPLISAVMRTSLNPFSILTPIGNPYK
jgi:hypothetical protein